MLNLSPINARMLQIFIIAIVVLFFGYYLYLFLFEKMLNFPTVIIFVTVTLYVGMRVAKQTAENSAKKLKSSISTDFESELKDKIRQGLSYSNDSDKEERLSNSELNYVSGIAKKLIEKEMENINKDYLKQQFIWFFLFGFMGVFLIPLVLFLLSRMQF